MRMRLSNRTASLARLAKLRPVNVGARERWVSIAGGGLALAFGLRRRGWAGGLLSWLGSYLLLRGLSGRCLLYRTLGVTSARANDGGLWGHYTVHVHERIQVRLPREAVYRAWRNLELLPQVMRHLRVVRVDGNRSHWQARMPPGLRARWEAQIVQDTPHERLVWRSTPSSRIENRGEVIFRPSVPDATEIDIDLYYRLPGGMLARLLALPFGSLSARLIRQDLERFQEFLETREAPSEVHDQGLGREEAMPRHG